MKQSVMLKKPGLAAAVLLVGVAATGCVERRVEYGPVYRAQTGSQAQPPYGQQTVYQPQPGTALAPTTNWPSPEPPPANTNAPPASFAQQPATAVVTQAPPPPQVEVVPMAPGRDYYWVPGYWCWGSPGWVWIGGSWTIRPWHGAIWVRGGWVGHRGRWGWHGGHWR
jgi:hypothetical protein